MDLFIYLPANVTFISDTLNIQWSRWLWREKNAEFSLKFPVRIRSKINLDSVGMNESKTSFRQQLWRALPDWQICIFQFGKGGCRGLKQMHTDWQSLPYLLHSIPKRQGEWQEGCTDQYRFNLLEQSVLRPKFKWYFKKKKKKTPTINYCNISLLEFSLQILCYFSHQIVGSLWF